jgi:hypothetical protein
MYKDLVDEEMSLLSGALGLTVLCQRVLGFIEGVARESHFCTLCWMTGFMRPAPTGRGLTW